MKKTILTFIGTLALAISMSSAWAVETIHPSTCKVTHLQLYNINTPELLESVESALTAKGYDLSLLDMQNAPGWRYSSTSDEYTGLSIYAGERISEAQIPNDPTRTRREERRSRRYARRGSGSSKSMYITGPAQRSADYGTYVPRLFTTDSRLRRFQRTLSRRQDKVANWVIDQLPECQASSL